MIEGLAVLDAHIHLDPAGDPKGAVQRFLKAGGSHLLIIHKPYHHIKENSIEAYRRSFDVTLKMRDLAIENGAEAECVIGPYPGSLPHLVKDMGLEEASNLQMEALDHAFSLVDEGKALGIGEVGRIHFPVEDEIQIRSDSIMEASMQGAAQRNCPVILHTDSPGTNPDLFRHIVNISDRSGMDRKKVVKHYSGWEAAEPSVGLGISISMQARKNNMEQALKRNLDFLLETDFIDDPNRPNVVMPPDTVPKKIRWAYKRGFLTKEKHEKLMVDLPEKVLGMETGT